MNGANDKELTYGEVQKAKGLCQVSDNPDVINAAKREMKKDSIEDINWTEKCFEKKKTLVFEAIKSESYDCFNLYDDRDNKVGILDIQMIDKNKNYTITINEIINSK